MFLGRRVTISAVRLYSILLLVAAIPLAHGPIFTNQHLPKLVLLALAIVLALTWFVAALPGWPAFRIKLSGLRAWWLLLLLVAALSAPGHVAPDSAVESVRYWSMLCLLFFITPAFNDRHWQHLYLLLVASGVIAAAYGIIQSIGAQPLHTFPTYGSTFGNVNFAAAYVATVMPLALALGSRRNVWLAAALCLSGFYLLRTGCRAAWLGVMAGFGIYAIGWLLFLRQSVSARKILLTVLVGLLVFVPFLLQDSWRRELTQRWSALHNWQEGSLKTRILIWDSTARMIRDKFWLGYGAGQFVHHFTPYRQAQEYLESHGRLVEDPHHTWLLLWVELGVPGILCFLLLTGTLGLRLIRILRHDNRPDIRRLAIGQLGSLVAWLVFGLTASPLLWPATALILPLMSGWTELYTPARHELNLPLRYFPKIVLGAATLAALYFITTGTFRQATADILLNHGQREMTAHRFSQAVPYLAAAYTCYPNGIHLVEYGRSLLAIQEYQEASRVLELATNEAPAIEAGYIDAGLCYLQLGKNDKTLAVWEKAKRLFPASAINHYNLGQLLLKLDRNDEAITALLQAGLLAPDMTRSSDYHIHLGLCYEAKQELKQALLCYDRAKELQPQRALPYLRLGILMERLGLPDQCLYYLQRVLSSGNNQEQSHAYLHMGTIYEAESQFSQALSCYRLAIERQRLLPEAYVKLGELLARNGHWNAAHVVFSKLAMLTPQRPWPWLYLALTSWMVQEHGHPLVYLQRAVDTGFTDWPLLERQALFQELTQTDVYRTFRANFPDGK